MPDVSRQDLINALQRLTDTERAQIQVEVSESESREAARDKAAEALSDFIQPTRKA